MMTPRPDRHWRLLTLRLLRCERGSIAILTAVFIVMFVGLAALTVDVGYFFFMQQKLQAASDDAALAASFDPSRAAAIARASLDDNGFSDAEITAIDAGRYTDDPDLTPASRFTIATPNDAVRLSVQYHASAFFSKALGGAASVALGASSTAENLPIGAFSAVVNLADLNSSSTSTLLTAAGGAPISISAAELTALSQTGVNLLSLTSQLAILEGTPTATVEDVLATPVTLAQLAQALYNTISADATPPLDSTTSTALTALDAIAQTATNSAATPLEDVVGIGVHQLRPVADMTSVTTGGIEAHPLDALIALSQSLAGDQPHDINETISVAGIGNVSIEILMSQPVLTGLQGAPVSASGPVGTSVYTSTSRVRMTAQVTLPSLPTVGQIQLDIPIILDIGYGQATLTSLTCGSDIATTTDMGITAQSGAATVYLGSVSDPQFYDLSTPLAPSTATLANLSLITITAYDQETAQTQQSTLHFDRTDMANGTSKSTGAVSLQNAMTNLGTNAQITVTDSVPLVDLGPLAEPLVRTAISDVGQALASALPAYLDGFGMPLGTMDVTATSARCGLPVLVN